MSQHAQTPATDIPTGAENRSDLSAEHESPNLRSMLHRRFAIAFSAAALLVVLNQLLVQPRVMELTTDAPVINVAGRQRMLSQRLSKAALATLHATSDIQRQERLTELRETLALWSRSHQGLQSGDAAASLPGNNSRAVQAAFAGLDPDFAAMRDAAAALIADPEDPAIHVQTILDHEAEYLRRMDHIVNLYEAEARARVRRLAWTGWGLAGLVLIALGGVGFFVLLPAGRTIEQQFAALREASLRLEDRVRERTKALEHANAARHQEHLERLAAEEQQRRLVEKFAQVARINTAGEMVSGLAHELNQPLGAVANYVEGCLVHVERGDAALAELKVQLEKALGAALRAGRIVKRIRMSMMREAPEKSAIDPGQLITEVASFLEDEAARRGIAIQVRLAPDLQPLKGDAIQLQQVLINLVSNACDAVEAAKPSEPVVTLEATPGEPGWTLLVVADNGEGIAPEERNRIFDAFHSSRAQGMGMGLAIVRSIVEAHQGVIAVESVVGSGSRFTVKLPTHEHAQSTSRDRAHRR